MKYSYRFVEDFKESLKEPIEILETDSEYDRQLKLDVIESKKQLKAAMDRGEDIAQIMTDTRNELRRLGQYRDELKKELHKVSEAIQYSDPMTNDSVAQLDEMIKGKVSELKYLCQSNNKAEAMQACFKLQAYVKERNAKLLISK